MKYYIYISDAKVDMLLPQIPHTGKKKTARELGFDLKILKLTRKTEEETESNRISRLETVVSFIRKYGNVGSIDEPDEFIDDSQEIWFADATPEIAAFTGKTELTDFALVGSTKHIIGAAPDPNLPTGSLLYSILSWLFSYESGNEGDYDQKNALTIVSEITKINARSRRPTQRLEFMAKRLLFRKKETLPASRNTLLATPLYVSMTD
jgi:hypothetical protein